MEYSRTHLGLLRQQAIKAFFKRACPESNDFAGVFFHAPPLKREAGDAVGANQLATAYGDKVLSHFNLAGAQLGVWRAELNRGGILVRDNDFILEEATGCGDLLGLVKRVDEGGLRAVNIILGLRPMDKKATPPVPLSPTIYARVPVMGRG
jgi:hypothetical protein